jgi:hypothetical protein
MSWIDKRIHNLDENWLFRSLHNLFIKARYKLRFLKLSAFLTFALFGCIYFVLSRLILADLAIIDALLQPFNLTTESMTSYQISHTASLIDNFIFFVTVGLGITIYGLIKPEDSSFDKKINYLFPRAATTIGGKRYLKKQINKLAIIAPRTRVTYQLDEHCDEHHLTKMTMIYESKISNLHNKEFFMDGDVQLKFSISDKSKAALNNKYPNDNRYWGKITQIRTMTSDDLDKWRWHTKGKHLMISGRKSEIFKLEKLVIPPSGEAQIDCTSTTWSSNDGVEFDSFGVARFTELLEFYIVNNTHFNAKVEMYKIPRELYNNSGEFDESVLDKRKSITFELDPADHEQTDFKLSKHRGREFLSDFSVDDLMIWRVNFSNPLVNKTATKKL